MLRRRSIIGVALVWLPWWFLLLPASANDALVFASWNVRNYVLTPPVDREGTPPLAPKTKKSVQAVVQTLAAISPDIVGLCEMGSLSDLTDLQERLKKAGVDLPHRAWVDGADQVRHLALLSRFPLKPPQHDTESSFTINRISHRVQRGFLDSTAVIRPNFHLRILGAHLKSPRIVPAFDPVLFRRQESLVLRARVENILTKNPEASLILFGDLNDKKNSPVLRSLLGRPGSESALTNLTLPDQGGDHWTYYWDETDQYSRIDYILVSGRLRSLINKKKSRIHRTANWMEASDHRPLVVTIHIPSPDTKP